MSDVSGNESKPTRNQVEELLKSFEASKYPPFEGLNEASDNESKNFEASEAESAKTSLQMKYQAEVNVIKSKIGDIEEVRQTLGLSRRKMCQLLLVDPSAWTRWTKTGRVPLHIYRALQWYMALIDKEPAWHPQNSFDQRQMGNLHNEIAILRKDLQTLKKSHSQGQIQVVKVVLMLSGALLLGVLIGKL